MKYFNYFRYLIGGVLIFTLSFAGCKKTKVSSPMGDAGQTLVQILNGDSPTASAIFKNPVDFVNTPTRILAVQLRRDVPNNAELQKTMVVTVKDDSTAVNAANPNYKQLPTSWYTLSYGSGGSSKSGGIAVGQPNAGRGGTFTFTFAPGEFSKEIYVTIPDATLMDPSSLYGLGFTIMTADAGSVLSTRKGLVLEIGAKNSYDGVYAVTGPMVDLTGAPFTQWNNPASPGFPADNGGAWEGHLVTTGATQCILVDQTIWGSCGHPMLNAGANSGFGSYGLVVNFNPSNGAIASIFNYYGDPTRAATNLGSPSAGTGPPAYAASNTRAATLDPSGINAVQGNKDILIKYFMIQPSVVPAAPSIRVTFDEKWKYKGSR